MLLLSEAEQKQIMRLGSVAAKIRRRRTKVWLLLRKSLAALL